MYYCGGLHKNGPHRFIFKYLVPSWQGRIGRFGLAGEGLSLGVDFEVLKETLKA